MSFGFVQLRPDTLMAMATRTKPLITARLKFELAGCLICLATEDLHRHMCELFAGQKKSNYQFLTRSIRLNGQCTSVRLERKFWNILDAMAANEDVSTPLFISKIHTEVTALHGEARNFASLLRCACLVYLETRTEATSA